MSWGPSGNKDMWNQKKLERVTDDEYKCLHYGPDTHLILELEEDGWCWMEKQLDTKKNIVQKDRFSTCYEAIQNYEEVTEHQC